MCDHRGVDLNVRFWQHIILDVTKMVFYLLLNLHGCNADHTASNNSNYKYRVNDLRKHSMTHFTYKMWLRTEMLS